MKSEQIAPLNILLADDDTDDCFFFEKALKEIPMNTNLNIVNNGEQLMDYLSLNLMNLPDVIFLDLSMPRKTGFECLLEIKEDKKLEHIPVIMFSTSYTRGMDLEQNLITTLTKMGAQEYIRKPGDFTQLKQVIHEAIERIIKKAI